MNFNKCGYGAAACMIALTAWNPVCAAEISADQRLAARIYAQIDAPLANRDQRAYCSAFYGTTDYRGYVGRACEFGVKMGTHKPEQCTVQAVAAKAEIDHKKCLEMDSAAFDAAIAKHGEVRSKFIKEVAESGIDGNKLIAEERAKPTN